MWVDERAAGGVMSDVTTVVSAAWPDIYLISFGATTAGVSGSPTTPNALGGWATVRLPSGLACAATTG